MAPRRPCILTLLILLLAGWSAWAWAQPIDEAKLARVKAAYLYHMVQLTYWPVTPEDTPGPLQIVCIGHDAAGVGELLAARAGQADQEVTLTVRTLASLTERGPEATPLAELLAGARIIYLGRDVPAAEITALLDSRAPAVLLAGDGPEFALHEGMVGFFVLDQRVRIAVNLARVEAVGIRLSAEFLQHAEIVSEGQGG